MNLDDDALLTKIVSDLLEGQSSFDAIGADPHALYYFIKGMVAHSREQAGDQITDEDLSTLAMHCMAVGAEFVRRKADEAQG